MKAESLRQPHFVLSATFYSFVVLPQNNFIYTFTRIDQLSLATGGKAGGRNMVCVCERERHL